MRIVGYSNMIIKVLWGCLRVREWFGVERILGVLSFSFFRVKREKDFY